MIINKNMPFFRLILLFLFCFSFPAHAQNNERNANLKIFASQSAVKKGGEIDIAIQQNIRDGWHTYWYNAGDSGEPTSIQWDLPENVTISDIQFPTPKKIFYDPLVNFGYEGTPIYLQTITVDDDFEGDEVVLNGQAFWLVCEEICIPEEQSVSITIPVNNNIVQINQAIFETADNAMPIEQSWNAELSKDDNKALLKVSVPEEFHNQMTDVEIYPYDWGIIKTTSEAIADIRDDHVIFEMIAGSRDFAEMTDPRIIIKTANESYMVQADANNVADMVNHSPTPLLLIIIFALLGGIILNLMPCVFPVLSMKALSLVKISSKDKRHIRLSGLAYTAGIILSFLIIAGILIALKAGGESIGWGFQLQNPYIVFGLATLLFLFGLNLLGLFEISSKWTGIGSRFTKGDDIQSSFFTGVLATLVATPCTAPFMGTAMGYALTQNAFVALIVFAALGLGLALPYLLITFIPAAQKFLPKPGAWMVTFKQFLAFPMLASCIWLIWVLEQQTGDLSILYVLGVFLSIGLILWMVNAGIKKLIIIIAAIILAMAAFAYSGLLKTVDTGPDYQSFTSERLDQILSENPESPVFVNMTAAWCITCLMNERTTLSSEAVQKVFEDNNVIYMKGDWTNRNDEITQYLENYGRNGVPLYVYYGLGNSDGIRPQGQVLPQILTPAIVLDLFKGENR
jgi:thiol:disulfide interchange protein DsbD